MGQNTFYKSPPVQSLCRGPIYGLATPFALLPYLCPIARPLDLQTQPAFGPLSPQQALCHPSETPPPPPPRRNPPGTVDSLSRGRRPPLQQPHAGFNPLQGLFTTSTRFEVVKSSRRIDRTIVNTMHLRASIWLSHPEGERHGERNKHARTPQICLLLERATLVVGPRGWPSPHNHHYIAPPPPHVVYGTLENGSRRRGLGMRRWALTVGATLGRPWRRLI